MTTTERDTRTQILDAAARVFPRLGYARTTIADLAEAAGVSRPTVYAYFGSKDDVFGALARRVRDEFLSLQEEAAAATPAETLQRALLAYLDAWVRNLGVLTVLAHQALSDPAAAALRNEIHERADRRHTRFTERLVAQGLANPAVPPPVVSQLLTGLTMRLAEEVAAAPERRDELGAHLVAAHTRILGLR